MPGPTGNLQNAEGKTPPPAPRVSSEGLLRYRWLLAFLALAFVLLATWISCRFNFIVLDFMTRGQVSIKESFLRHRGAGNSFFKISVLYFMASILLFLLLLLLIVLVAKLKMGLMLVVLIPLMLLMILTAVWVMLVVVDFILPIMYQERLSVLGAVDKFFDFEPPIRDIVVYLLLKTGLGIAVLIIAGLGILAAGLVLMFAVAFAGFLFVALSGFLAAALPFLKPLLAAAGFILLVGSIFCTMVVIGMVTLPVAVFFRALALGYLSRLIPAYDLLKARGSNEPALS